MQRHVDDLKRKDWEYYFDEDEAARVLSLYKMFRFSKGSVSGEPFDLMPWFAALVYMAFGWRREGGYKRFSTVYCKVARGNAKTANLVTIGTIGFLFDNVPDAEVYWLATKKDQAKIGWDRQRKMTEMLVKDYPELKELINIPKGHTSTKVSRTDTLSWFTYLGRDSDKEDGASPSLIIVDEFHAWDDTSVMDVQESGSVKVQDPSTWIITTAGYKPQGPNSDLLRSCKNMLLGVVESPETLAFIYELDENDDWTDKRVWGKPNPALGTSALSMDGLEREFKKIAIKGIEKERDFKVKNLNIEMSSQEGWIPDDVWMKGSDTFNASALHGRECWGGLDLANTNDFNAFVLFFPPLYEGDKAYILPYFWIPENAVEKFHQKRPFVARWADEGFIKLTDGNTTDYDLIHDGIMQAIEPFNCVGVAYDTAFSAYLTPRLMASGVRMEPYPQSPMWLTPPAKQVELLANFQKKDGDTIIWENALKHGGNPVMRWMMANVTIKITDAGNSIPARGRSAEKIDGVAALLDAVGQWLKDRGNPQGSSYLFEPDTELIVI